MRENKRGTKAPSLAMIIWSNIVRQQYLKGLDDDQLSTLLGITTRTLYNYRADPSALTLKQLQSIVEKLNIEMESLLLARLIPKVNATECSVERRLISKIA